MKSSLKLENKLQRRVIGNVTGQGISEDCNVPWDHWEARHGFQSNKYGDLLLLMMVSV